MEFAFFPKYILKKISPYFLVQNDLNILLSNFFIILLFLLCKDTLIVFLNHLPHFCLFDKLFSFQCPVCGMTRGLCEMAKGNYKIAYKLNVSSILLSFYIFAQIPLRLISLTNHNSQTFSVSINKISKKIGQLIIIVIVLCWVMKLIMML